MKTVFNIPGATKLIDCLKYMHPYKRKIDAARRAGDFEKEREYILKATSSWGPMVMDMFGSKINVQGRENIPESGPVVIMGNHQGYADIVAYFAVFTKFQIGFVAKKELAKIPFYGKWIERVRSVLIERDDPKASLQAIKKGIEYINAGFSLVIFPEGTRSKGAEPGPFMRGATKLATRPGVPIIPVSMEGTYKMFEATGRIEGAEINAIVHRPIETKDISRQEEKDLPDKVEKIIVDGVKELRRQP